MSNIGNSKTSSSISSLFYVDTSYKVQDKPELRVKENFNFNDEKLVEKKISGRIPNSNINFNDFQNDNSILAKASDENGNDLLDEKGNPIYVKVNENGEPLLDKNGNYQLFNSDFKPISNNTSNEEYAIANDETGKPILDNKGNPIYIKLDKNGEPLKDKNGNYLTFDLNLNPIDLNSISGLEKTSSSEVEIVPLLDNEGKQVNDENGNPLKIKVNSDGTPYINENRKSILVNIEGQEIEIESLEPRKLIPATYKDGSPMVDEKGRQYQILVYEKDLTPVKDKKGKNIYADPNGKILTEDIPYWQKRLMDWDKYGGKMLIEPILRGNSFLSIPHKIATYLVKKEVANTLTQSIKLTSEKIANQGIKNLGKTTDKALVSTLDKLLARQSGEVLLPSVIKSVSKETNKTISKTITHLSEKGLEEGLKNSTKILEKSGKLGQGIKVVTMSEARAVFGSKLNPLAHIKGYSNAVKESVQGVQKIVVKEISEKGVIDGTKSIFKGTMKGASEKALENILKEGSEQAVKKVMKDLIKQSTSKISSEALEKISAEALQVYSKKGSEVAAKFILSKTGGATTKILEKDLAKQISKGVAEATVKASEKGSVKFATRLSAAAPIISTAIGVGITTWDTIDAIKKTKDPRVTKLSAGLAWATVGLDVINVASQSSGVGAPIGWIATGLSIGTSILSDVYKYKE